MAFLDVATFIPTSQEILELEARRRLSVSAAAALVRLIAEFLVDADPHGRGSIPAAWSARPGVPPGADRETS